MLAVTFNICLGRDFEGAGLTFCGYMGQAEHRHFSYRHQHVKGHAIVHLGRRRHGADDITRGERLNLIVWNTNLAFRSSNDYLELQKQQRYEKESGPPDEVCAVGLERAAAACTALTLPPLSVDLSLSGLLELHT